MPTPKVNILVGTSKSDHLNGGPNTDIISGFGGDDVINGGAGNDFLYGGDGNDTLNGGPGSDLVSGDNGNDILIYNASENTGKSQDLYFGGLGVDYLRLELTAAQWANAGVKKDVANFLAFIARHTMPNGQADFIPFTFKSFGLTVSEIEKLSLYVDGVLVDPNHHPGITVDLTSYTAPSIVDSQNPTLGTPVNVTLGPNAADLHFTVQLHVDPIPPLADVYMLQDLTGSFTEDLPNVQALFPTLYTSLNNGVLQTDFGTGTFEDLPGYGGAPTDYVFQPGQAITSSQADVQNALNGEVIGDGVDYPEAQLWALMIAAKEPDTIGWRDNSQRFVTIFSDAPSHLPGDFPGLTVPNNGDAAIDPNEDYPSIAQVGAALTAAHITPIFTVTSDVTSFYQNIVDTWGFGKVVTLSSDSSNIVSAVTDGLTATSVDLTPVIAGDTYGLVKGVTPTSYTGIAPPADPTFDVSLGINPANTYGPETLTFTVPGYGTSTININVDAGTATGTAYDDTLIGNNGPNTFDGKGGTDTITTNGGSDTMIIGNGVGTSIVTDFLPGTDHLQLYAGVTATSATAVGSDTDILFSDGSHAKLLGLGAILADLSQVNSAGVFV